MEPHAVPSDRIRAHGRYLFQRAQYAQLIPAGRIVLLASFRAKTKSPHPEERPMGPRLEGWATTGLVPTSARGLPPAIETAAEFAPRCSRGGLLRVRSLAVAAIGFHYCRNDSGLFACVP